MTDEPGMCSCPPAWFGTVPPACPVHNPMRGTVATVTTFEVRCVCKEGTAGRSACPVHRDQGWPPNIAGGAIPMLFTLTKFEAPPLSDADVERIARRVVELLKEST